MAWACVQIEDEYYGHPKRMTYSQRDVPGLTRAAIPLLTKAGVKGVTVGENGACAPVNVPPIFLCKPQTIAQNALMLPCQGKTGMRGGSDDLT